MLGIKYEFFEIPSREIAIHIKVIATLCVATLWFVLILQWFQLGSQLSVARDAVRHEFFARASLQAGMLKVLDICQEKGLMSEDSRGPAEQTCQTASTMGPQPSVQRELQLLQEKEKAAARAVIATAPAPVRWFAKR